MRAVIIDKFGGPEVLRVKDVPTPEPDPGQILVRVRSAGVNFAETLMRQDRYATTPPLPSILGTEVAGDVVGLGAGVETIAAGDRVAAPLYAAGVFFGGYAEYAVIDAKWAIPLPASASYDEAVVLMVQGLTALHLVRRTSPAGKRTFVSAAAGGVGSLLIQLLKEAGAASVIAGASTDEKRQAALSLGADEAVDYTQPEWQLSLSSTDRPDIIYESTGGAVTRAGLGILAPQGEMIIFGALNIQDFNLGVPDLLALIFNNQSVTGFALVPLLTPETVRADLALLFDLVKGGGLKLHIGNIYPLEQAEEAHRALEGRLTMGKAILHP